VAGLGGVCIGIAITEYHPPWSSAWFIAGAIVSALGLLCAIWSLILYLARKQAVGHWCPDPRAHIVKTGQAGSQLDQSGDENHRDPSTVRPQETTSLESPLNGLEVVIDDERVTPFPGLASILEVEYHVTNHDPVPHYLRRSARGRDFYFPSNESSPEHDRFRSAYAAISERERRELLPSRVRVGETVHGVYVMEFAWDPTGKLPDYTLIISDGRRDYSARPHGAPETLQGA
jgi:hypothetical protein